MDEEMIEQIARALCQANFIQQGAQGEFGNVDDCWFVWIDEARAAHSVIAGKIAELRDAAEGYLLANETFDFAIVREAEERLRAALAQHKGTDR